MATPPKATLDDLIDSVASLDTLYVLYHLQTLEDGLGPSLATTSHRSNGLTALEAAVFPSTPGNRPQPQRRAFILRVLLLAGCEPHLLVPSASSAHKRAQNSKDQLALSIFEEWDARTGDEPEWNDAHTALAYPFDAPLWKWLQRKDLDGQMMKDDPMMTDAEIDAELARETRAALLAQEQERVDVEPPQPPPSPSPAPAPAQDDAPTFDLPKSETIESLSTLVIAEKERPRSPPIRHATTTPPPRRRPVSTSTTPKAPFPVPPQASTLLSSPELPPTLDSNPHEAPPKKVGPASVVAPINSPLASHVEVPITGTRPIALEFIEGPPKFPPPINSASPPPPPSATPPPRPPTTSPLKSHLTSLQSRPSGRLLDRIEPRESDRWAPTSESQRAAPASRRGDDRRARYDQGSHYEPDDRRTTSNRFEISDDRRFRPSSDHVRGGRTRPSSPTRRASQGDHDRFAPPPHARNDLYRYSQPLRPPPHPLPNPQPYPLPDRPPATLFIGGLPTNLPCTVLQDQLVRILKKIVPKSEIVQIRVRSDNGGMGGSFKTQFAFIHLRDGADKYKIIAELNGKHIFFDGQYLNVKLYTDEPVQAPKPTARTTKEPAFHSPDVAPSIEARYRPPPPLPTSERRGPSRSRSRSLSPSVARAREREKGGRSRPASPHHVSDRDSTPTPTVRAHTWIDDPKAPQRSSSPLVAPQTAQDLAEEARLAALPLLATDLAHIKTIWEPLETSSHPFYSRQVTLTADFGWVPPTAATRALTLGAAPFANDQPLQLHYEALLAAQSGESAQVYVDFVEKVEAHNVKVEMFQRVAREMAENSLDADRRAERMEVDRCGDGLGRKEPTREVVKFAFLAGVRVAFGV